MVMWTIQKGSDIDVVDKFNNSALKLAITAGKSTQMELTDICIYLTEDTLLTLKLVTFSDKPLSVHASGDKIHPFLYTHFLCKKKRSKKLLFYLGFTEAAELLIRKGADVNVVGQDGGTAVK